MSKISNKKRGLVKRNVLRLLSEERNRHTGLAHRIAKVQTNKNNTEVLIHDPLSHREKGTHSIPSWKSILLATILFVITSLVIYFPSLNGEFHFDDTVFQTDPLIQITQLSQLFDLVTAKELGRRIGLVTFALNYYWGGFNPFAYRLVNVLIHSFNGLMLFLLSFTMLTLFSGKRDDSRGALTIAFLGSLLWLVHPLQIQAVAYIVQRLTSLCALFFLLSFFCYLQGRLDHARKGLVFYVLSFLFGLLAIDTKQNAATLPLFIILAEFFFYSLPRKSKNTHNT